MKILAIETSCDETAVALYDGEKGLLGQQIYSQIDIHKTYGGVVPELASRDHIRKILPLINNVLSREPRQHGAGQDNPKDLTSQQHRANNTLHPDAIAYTKGPGLVGALMVGATLAHSLAYAWNIPVLGVHHIEAHLMAVMLEENKPSYPFLSLIVSGGHTMLMQVNAFGDYQLLGQSLDDAVGEAFDKTAILLGLSYPGGPELAKLAEQGNPKRFTFPRPMVDRPGLDFSFSGLKTFAMHCIKKNPNARVDIACAFEDAVVDTLRIKCQRALEKTGLNQLVVAGGVSANTKLRHVLKEVMDVAVFFPRHEFCTDNAAMVAYTGYERLNRGERDDLSIGVKARWDL